VVEGLLLVYDVLTSEEDEIPVLEETEEGVDDTATLGALGRPRARPLPISLNVPPKGHSVQKRFEPNQNKKIRTKV